jgi:hypothetical protein
MNLNTTIPAINLEGLKKRITKLNKRATKLGLEPITLTEGSRHIGKCYHSGTSTPFPTELVAVTISGDVPVVEGYELIGVTGHEAGVNIVKLNIGGKMPKSHWDNENNCDHCGYKRKRKETYVLKAEGNDGYMLRVGKSCLKDFFRNPNAITYGASLAGFFDSFGDEFGFLPTLPEAYPVRLFLAMTNAVVEKNGFMSRRRHYAGGEVTTRNRVVESFKCLSSERLIAELTDAHYAAADDAITWGKDLKHSDNEYLHNLGCVVEYDIATTAHLGLLASLPDAHRREKKRLEDEVDAAKCEWVGMVDHPITLSVMVEGVKPFNGHYGGGIMYRFRDFSGNVLIWFKSGRALPNINTGATMTLSGTVKKHDTFNGRAQTLVKRCKLS